MMSFRLPPVKRLSCICLIVVAVFLDLSAQLQVPRPVTTDLWDVSRGTVVTGNSPVLGISDARNLLGFVVESSEVSSLLFADAQPQGFVHFVQWQTPLPNSLRSFILHAAHDGAPFDANKRGFSRFTLLARNPETDDFDVQLFEIFPALLYEDTVVPPDVLFEADRRNHLRLCVNVDPTQSQEFRAEFAQFGPPSPNQSGPRVLEIDGYDTLCPGSLLQISIDIDPGSGLNAINCRNRSRIITVALLSEEGFDATSVDPETVTFAGAPITWVSRRDRLRAPYRRYQDPPGEEAGAEYFRARDVDGDGDVDLQLFFSLRQTTLTCLSTEGKLTGETFQGVLIESTHSLGLAQRGPRVIRTSGS